MLTLCQKCQTWRGHVLTKLLTMLTLSVKSNITRRPANIVVDYDYANTLSVMSNMTRTRVNIVVDYAECRHTVCLDWLFRLGVSVVITTRTRCWRSCRLCGQHWTQCRMVNYYYAMTMLCRQLHTATLKAYSRWPWVHHIWYKQWCTLEGAGGVPSV